MFTLAKNALKIFYLIMLAICPKSGLTKSKSCRVCVCLHMCACQSIQPFICFVLVLICNYRVSHVATISVKMSRSIFYSIRFFLAKQNDLIKGFWIGI
jgi:hypothetical protein